MENTIENVNAIEGLSVSGLLFAESKDERNEQTAEEEFNEEFEGEE